MRYKLLFYSPQPTYATGEVIPYKYHAHNIISPSFAAIYLDTYIKQTEPELHEKIHWDIILLKTSTNDLVEYIINNEISMVLVSYYVWHSSALPNQIKEVKERLSNRDITFAVGGPQVPLLSFNKSKISEFNFFDYINFGQGEKAFVQILQKEINGVPVPATATNLAVKLPDGNFQIGGFEQKLIPPFRVYVDNEPLVDLYINYVKKNLPNFTIAWVFETSKGCAYRCSFCDWGQGEKPAMSKNKTNSYIEEIDFFVKKGMHALVLGDALFGQWADDIKVIEYLVKKKTDDGVPFFIYMLNLTKNLFDTQEKILDITLGSDLAYHPKISQQSKSEVVLKNVNRPSMKWDECLAMTKRLIKKHNKKLGIELIFGLPGETVESFESSLIDIDNLHLPVQIILYPWTLLPNSPGYSNSYREKFQIHSEFLLYVAGDIQTPILVSDYVTSDTQELVLSTYSYSKEDWVSMLLIGTIASYLISNRKYGTLPLILNYIRKSGIEKSLKEKILIGIEKFKSPIIPLGNKFYSLGLILNWLFNDPLRKKLLLKILKCDVRVESTLFDELQSQIKLL